MSKTNYDKKYYQIEIDGNGNYPLLEWDDDRNPEGLDDTAFAADVPIDYIDFVINLILGAPVPEKPELVDYHYMPPDVFSDKIADVIKEIGINTGQLFPARIWIKETPYEGYHVFHAYKEIACMHKDRSDFIQRTMRINLKKLSLDERVLDKIELKDRLVFLLEESPSNVLYHQSVVDKIMATNPKGVRFIRIDQWNIGSAFD